MINKLKIALSLLALLISTSINATIISGSCGENATYRLEDDGTLYIEGSGDMTDYTWTAPWRNNDDAIPILKAQISDGITSIGEYAFCACSALKSITIPNSVTKIGASAFYDCKSLTSITIPNSVTSMGGYAFSGCSALTSISISNSLTSIGASAFQDCTSLNSITIPNSVTSIGGYAFSGCTSLTSVTIPNSVTSIGGYAFKDCTSLPSIIIPNFVTSIGEYAFHCCTHLNSIIIPSSVAYIGDHAFENCTSFPIVNGIRYADTYLINAVDKSLKECTIREDTKFIGSGAFIDCSSLVSITIPNSVTNIGYSAFMGCTSLTSITIPNSVTEIGALAFGACTGLRTIHSQSLVPPNAMSNCFMRVNTNYCKLYVPIGAKGNYSFAQEWQNFLNIIEEYVPIAGDNQCAPPTIAYEDGHLKFVSPTPNATYLYTISDADIKQELTASENGNIELVAAYEITAYAKAEGYGTSAPSIATIYWLNGSIGDANNAKAITLDRRPIIASSNNGVITLKGLGNAELASFYSTSGMYLGQTEAENGEIAFNATSHISNIIIAKIGNDSIKIRVK